MRRFINGEETDLDPRAAKVSRVSDRLIVHGSDGTHSAVALRAGDSVLISFRGQVYKVENARPRAKSGTSRDSGDLRAPMPGLIVDVLVSKGERVTAGQRVLVLEAMKTQQPFVAPFDGVVEELKVEKGSQVKDGDLLASLKPSEGV